MKATPLVLSLETATRGGSIFLAGGDMQLAARIGDHRVSQSASLLSDINNCLEEAGRSLDEVDLFACASGPGSFTGLRIGIATTKALAASLLRPCAGVPSLQAVAHAAGPSKGTVSLLPAGRGEVYAQMFFVSDDGVVTAVDTAVHLGPERLLERYASFANLTWAGSGAELQRDLLRRDADQRDGWRFAAQETNLARSVAALALQAFQTGKLQSPEALSAIYVRPSDAELKELARN